MRKAAGKIGRGEGEMTWCVIETLFWRQIEKSFRIYIVRNPKLYRANQTGKIFYGTALQGLCIAAGRAQNRTEARSKQPENGKPTSHIYSID